MKYVGYRTHRGTVDELDAQSDQMPVIELVGIVGLLVVININLKGETSNRFRRSAVIDTHEVHQEMP